MLSHEVLKIVTDCAQDFDVKTVWLFGSSLDDEESAHDIDLAVEGLSPSKFFDFHSRLFWALNRLGRSRVSGSFTYPRL